jgi:hypothetical protein
MHYVLSCYPDLLPAEVRNDVCEVLDLIYKVEFSLNAAIPKDGGIEEFQSLVTTCIAKLIVLFKPFSKSQCCSKKFHLAMHWGAYVRDIGCGADEKQQEKELGILFKKPVKYTNSAIANTDEQVGDRVWDKVMLRGVAFDMGLSDTLFMNWKGLSVDAELHGDNFTDPCLRPLEGVVSCKPLGRPSPPNALYTPRILEPWTKYEFEDTIAGAMVLERARLLVARGDAVEPFALAPQCLLSFFNPVGGSRGVGQHDRVTLRAMPKFRGNPWYDNVRVKDGSGPDCRLAVGRCVCFLEDAQGTVFVGLRWYQDYEVRIPEDVETRLCRLDYLPRGNLESYDVFPVSTIINGALVLPSCDGAHPQHYYLIQTPREQADHNRRCLVTHE